MAEILKDVKSHLNLTTLKNNILKHRGPSNLRSELIFEQRCDSQKKILPLKQSGNKVRQLRMMVRPELVDINLDIFK